MSGLEVGPGREPPGRCSTTRGHALRSPGGQGGLSPRGHRDFGPGLLELDQLRDLVHITEDHSHSAIARILVLSKTGGKRNISVYLVSISHTANVAFTPTVCYD